MNPNWRISAKGCQSHARTLVTDPTELGAKPTGQWTDKAIAILRYQWNRLGQLPQTLRLSMMLSTISFVFGFGVCSDRSWFQVLEIVLIWRWDIWETEYDVRLFEQYGKDFSHFADAAYFVSFGEVTGTIKPKRKSALEKIRDEPTGWRPVRLRFPVTLALFLNAYFIVSMLDGVNSAICICPPWDVTCYYLILVPKVISCFLKASFLVLCQEKYLKRALLFSELKGTVQKD